MSECRAYDQGTCRDIDNRCGDSAVCCIACSMFDNCEDRCEDALAAAREGKC
jgi:hypothetical protein